MSLEDFLGNEDWRHDGLTEAHDDSIGRPARDDLTPASAHQVEFRKEHAINSACDPKRYDVDRELPED
jgi:hypothetical protein